MMWEKWVFIAALAGASCLMRAALGDIRTAGATELPSRLYEECALVAAEAGFAPRQKARDAATALLTADGSTLTASMLRDIEAQGRTEGAHILSDLLARRRASPQGLSLLELADTHVKAYEARRGRELRT